MFKRLLKKKKPTIKPKFKTGDKCIWHYKDITYDYFMDKLVVINNYMIDKDNTIKYIIIDLDTQIIYEWVDEKELYKI